MTSLPSSPSTSVSGEVERCGEVDAAAAAAAAAADEDADEEDTKIGASCSAPNAAMESPGAPTIPGGNAADVDA